MMLSFEGNEGFAFRWIVLSGVSNKIHDPFPETRSKIM